MPDPDVCISHCGGENDPHPACKAHDQGTWTPPDPLADIRPWLGKAGIPLEDWQADLVRQALAAKRHQPVKWAGPFPAVEELDELDGWYDSLDDLTLPGLPSLRQTATAITAALAVILIARKLVHRGS